MCDILSMKTVTYTRPAIRQLKRLKSEKDRIRAAVSGYAEEGRGDVRALSGPFAGLLRLRVGDWRVFFEETETEITILSVKTRGDAY